MVEWSLVSGPPVWEEATPCSIGGGGCGGEGGGGWGRGGFKRKYVYGSVCMGGSC